MRGLLTTNHPHLTVEVVVPDEPIDHHIVWILGDTIPTLPATTDLIVLVDTSLVSRTKLPEEAFEGKTMISIDHHESFSGAVPGYRDSSASSNTIILTEMAEML